MNAYALRTIPIKVSFTIMPTIPIKVSFTIMPLIRTRYLK